jgi:hypothetical protein
MSDLEIVNKWFLYPSAGAKAVGAAHPEEREIEIPDAERTVVTDFDAQQSP